jgi:rhodanese-related sulfurtransferase
MKRRILGIMMLIVIASLVMVLSCDKDETSETKFETLTNYLNANGMGFSELFSGWIVGADSTLHANMDDYYFMDLRGGDTNENEIIDYDEGHVPGAVLTSYGTLLEDAAQSGGKPIIMVCYTGQSAGHAVMALRLSGYMDARVLKWGMSGWHSDFDKWTANCHQLDHANWVAAPGAITASAEFDLPNLSAAGDSGEEILADRVAGLLSGGFMGISGGEVLDMPGDYFINNYWDAADVEQYGNIEGAYRLKPLNLENLDPDEVIVTYCWTGQTSSMLTAYLTVLGYNAKSLTFGANGMIYDQLEAHKWTGSADWDYEVTE